MGADERGQDAGAPGPTGAPPGPAGVAAPAGREHVAPGGGDHLFRMELVISRVLQIGVLVSAAVVAIGLLLLLIRGHSGYPRQGFPTTLAGVAAGVGQARPYAIIATGLLLLILTPVLRVAVGLVAFVLERDSTFVTVTGYVLAVLILSFFLGRSGW